MLECRPSVWLSVSAERGDDQAEGKRKSRLLDPSYAPPSALTTPSIGVAVEFDGGSSGDVSSGGGGRARGGATGDLTVVVVVDPERSPNGGGGPAGGVGEG